MSQSILLSIFLLRVFLPLVTGKELLIDHEESMPGYKTPQERKKEEAEFQEYLKRLEKLNDPKLTLITTTELPEYSEWLRRQEKTRTPIIKQEAHLKDSLHQAELQFQAPFPFPSIQLCKERPADGDYYGKLFIKLTLI